MYLISLRHKYNNKKHEEKTIETDRLKLLLDALKLAVIGRRDRIQNYTYLDIFELGPNVKYRTCKKIKGRKSEGYGANKAQQLYAFRKY
jgi:hypothetical protein